MKKDVRQVSWDEIHQKLQTYNYPTNIIYGIPRNGMLLCAFLTKAKITNDPGEATLFLDDIIDSGATRDKYKQAYPKIPFYSLYIAKKGSAWLQFPWETESSPEDGVLRILEYLGEDVKRDGLIDTPKRVIKALVEMTAGNALDPIEILSKTFAVEHNQMIVLREIQFTSLCEHHLLPFSGKASIGYIPTDKKIVGISKLVRLVECFSRRLQIQERMTDEIADAIVKSLSGSVGVIVTATHSCMACRGVRQNASMVTSALRGKFWEQPVREEFLALVKIL